MKEVKLPQELALELQKCNDLKKIEVSNIVNEIFEMYHVLKTEIDTIEIRGEMDLEAMKKCEVFRKKAKNVRIKAEGIFDEKRDKIKNEIAEITLEDKLWLKSKQIMQLTFKDIEQRADYKAKTHERYLKEQELKKYNERHSILSAITKDIEVDFMKMDENTFEIFVKMAIDKKEAEDNKNKIEAEKKALELEVKEIQKPEAFDHKKRETNDLYLLELELSKLRSNTPLADQQKNDNDAIKDWVNSFYLPNISIDNDVIKDIKNRFEGFKTWAKAKI